MLYISLTLLFQTTRADLFLNYKNENVPSYNPMPFKKKKKSENENINGLHVYINTLSILLSRAWFNSKPFKSFEF